VGQRPLRLTSGAEPRARQLRRVLRLRVFVDAAVDLRGDLRVRVSSEYGGFRERRARFERDGDE
jgi:hypothetical protein